MDPVIEFDDGPTAPASMLQSDDDILRAARAGSRDALGELVRRYAGLVYQAAWRHLGDEHLAQDATQATFELLARKITTLKTAAVLPAWCLSTTRNVCANLKKMEQRRTHHEKAAARLREEHVTTSPSDESAKMWADIAGQLDGIVCNLPPADRDVLLLRYFRRLSFREVAAALGVTETLARKRAERAIVKLREALAGGGIAVTGDALAAHLGAHAGTAAPAHVVTAATTAATTPAATTGVLIMSATKVKIAACLIAGLTILSTTALYTANRPPTKPITIATSQTASAAPSQEAERQAEFLRMYSLPQGRSLVRLPPPFPSGRMNFYRTSNPAQAALMPDGPDILLFARTPNGALDLRGIHFGNNALSLSSVLRAIAKLQRWEYEGNDDLLKTPLPGDWVFDEKANRDIILADLASVYLKLTGETVRFTSTQAEREVYVLRGNPEQKSGPNGAFFQVEADLPDSTLQPIQYGGPFMQVFEQLSEATGTIFIDESHAQAWHIQLAATPRVGKTLTSTLDDLARQLNVTITHERRMLNIIAVERGN